MALAHLMSTSSFQAVCCIERLKGNPAESTPMGTEMMGYPTRNQHLINSAMKIHYPLGPQFVDPAPYDHTAAVHRIEYLGHRLFYTLKRRRCPLRGTFSVCIPELASKSHSSCLVNCKFLVGCPDEAISTSFIHDT